MCELHGFHAETSCLAGHGVSLITVSRWSRCLAGHGVLLVTVSLCIPHARPRNDTARSASSAAGGRVVAENGKETTCW